MQMIFKQIYLTHRWNSRVDQREMIMKRYFTLLRSLELEPDNNIKFSVNHKPPSCPVGWDCRIHRLLLRKEV